MTLSELNRLDRAAFTAALGQLFEHSPWVAAEAWTRRPFADRGQLLAALLETLRAAQPEAQLALVRAHPDLAGKLSRAGNLTSQSAREQAGAGLDRLSDEEFARCHALNAAYRAKFGFPFVICVRANDKAKILAAFERRLLRDGETERAEALRQIGDIVRYRLDDLLGAG
jgi:OHCU decarboxylase